MFWVRTQSVSKVQFQAPIAYGSERQRGATSSFNLGLDPSSRYYLRLTMESYHYSQFPPELSTVYIALFTGVQNASQLRSRLIQAATMVGPDGEVEREAVNFSFIEARLVIDTSYAPINCQH